MPAGASSRPTACCEKYCAPTPRVARPFVRRRVLAVIHRHESQLVQPAGDGALRRDVSGGQAAAHGDAQHGVVAQRHRPRQRRHFAIVHHFEGNAAPRVPQFEKQAAHAACRTARAARAR